MKEKIIVIAKLINALADRNPDLEVDKIYLCDPLYPDGLDASCIPKEMTNAKTIYVLSDLDEKTSDCKYITYFITDDGEIKLIRLDKEGN